MLSLFRETLLRGDQNRRNSLCRIRVRPVRASLIIALLCFAAIAATAGEREDLIIRYQKETSELAKRDLALKMIDSGAIRLFDTTVTEIAKVFGKDWQPVGALGKG